MKYVDFTDFANFADFADSAYDQVRSFKGKINTSWKLMFVVKVVFVVHNFYICNLTKQCTELVKNFN